MRGYVLVPSVCLHTILLSCGLICVVSTVNEKWLQSELVYGLSQLLHWASSSKRLSMQHIISCLRVYMVHFWLGCLDRTLLALHSCQSWHLRYSHARVGLPKWTFCIRLCENAMHENLDDSFCLFGHIFEVTEPLRNTLPNTLEVISTK